MWNPTLVPCEPRGRGDASFPRHWNSGSTSVIAGSGLRGVKFRRCVAGGISAAFRLLPGNKPASLILVAFPLLGLFMVALSLHRPVFSSVGFVVLPTGAAGTQAMPASSPAGRRQEHSLEYGPHGAAPIAGMAILNKPRTTRHMSMAAASEDPQDGPIGDWVECDISYTPTVKDNEPRRTDTYVFHKAQLEEDFGHLYAKLGFTVQEGIMYKDIKAVCREPDGLNGVCNDCFKLIFGGPIGFVGMITPKYYGREGVTVDECISDSVELRAQEDALPGNNNPSTSYWCMRNA